MKTQKLNTRPHQILLTCPNCFQPMRIVHIEVDSGRELVALACQACNIEAVSESPPKPSASHFNLTGSLKVSPDAVNGS